MPRTEAVKCSWDGGAEREFRVTYLDDPEPRREAVDFFGRYVRLKPQEVIPNEFRGISVAEGQAYLDAHPISQRWELLIIGQKDLIFDEDLARLQHLPELTSVKIISSRVTDEGVRHLINLSNLRHLVLYSRRVTTFCLKYIEQLESLEVLDLQMAPRISRSAFAATVKKLPALSDHYAPVRHNWLAIYRWFYYEWRMQRGALNKE